MPTKDQKLAGLAERLRSMSLASRVFEAKPPMLSCWPRGFDRRIVRAVGEAFGASQLYSHQRKAIDAALSGRNVCLATETASGKTLAYLAPIAAAVAQDPSARAMIFYPTKALAWDQVEAVDRFSAALDQQGIALTFGKYDGDTPSAEKAAIRRGGRHIILTNPDMVHYAILRHHQQWGDFFRGLKYIVLDELHAYSGFFGTNVALVLRRVRQLCQRYGSNPTFIAASATIENAAAHTRNITGVDFKVITKSGSGSGRKEVMMLPPTGELPLAAMLATVATKVMGLRTIVFCNRRVDVEQQAKIVRKYVGPFVASYRAGYPVDERRQIHERLKSGEIRCVVATNALELGIDVGDLDLCILNGHPGTNAGAWQRLGRVGRHHDSNTLGVLALAPEEIDLYYARYPDEFFESKGRPERAMVTPSNPELLHRHLACALLESAGQPLDLDVFPAGTNGVLPEVEVPASPYTAYWDVPIRFIRPPFAIRDTVNDREIEEIDGNVAHREAHWGAVYLHQGKHYRIEKWCGGRSRQIECKPESARELVTWPEIDVSVGLTEAFSGFDFSTTGRPVMPFLHGAVHLEEKTVGYWEVNNDTKRRHHHGFRWPRGIQLDSEAFVLVLGPELSGRLLSRSGQNAPTAVLHGLGHLLVGAMVRSGAAGTADLLEYALPYCPFVEGPALYLCEAVPGGLGFAQELFASLETYLELAHERIQRCPCVRVKGCPACTLYKRRCPQRNEPLDKLLLREFLDGLMGTLGPGPRQPWTPPPPPPLPRRGENWSAGDAYPGGGKVLLQDDAGVVIRLPSGEPYPLPWLD